MRAEAATLREVFENVALVGHPDPGGNHVFLASDAPLPGAARAPSSTCPDGDVLRDDDAPADQLLTPARMKDEVEQIAAMDDPVIRNLRITECYSRLAAAMPPGGANWCTFATWASRQAGRTIRGEDLLYRLQGELRRDAELLHPIQSFWRWLLRRGLLRENTWFGEAAHAVRRLRAGERRRRAREPEGVRRDRPRVRPLARRRRHARPSRRSCARPSRATSSGRRPSRSCSPTSRSGCTSRRGCSRRSARRWTPRWRPTRRLLAWPLQRKLTQLSREVITESLMVLTLPGRRAVRSGRNLEVGRRA